MTVTLDYWMIPFAGIFLGCAKNAIEERECNTPLLFLVSSWTLLAMARWLP